MTETDLRQTIRVSTARDMAAVDALLSRSYPALIKADYPPSLLVTAVPLLSRAKPELLTSGSYYVAETGDGAIVGAGGWTRHRRQRGGADIRHVVTDHRMARRGIGRALLSRAMADAEAVGITLFDCMATRTAVHSTTKYLTG
ncbi:MAG: GNAT family N-acetyltransferase, partial [Pseudomonadota bacterium]